MKTVVVDSYHCQRCNALIGSVDRAATPAAAPAAAESEAPAEEAAPAAEETVEAAAGGDER
jgi:hypothetical protein